MGLDVSCPAAEGVGFDFTFPSQRAIIKKTSCQSPRGLNHEESEAIMHSSTKAFQLGRVRLHTYGVRPAFSRDDTGIGKRKGSYQRALLPR
jgi:hypothetical protein